MSKNKTDRGISDMSLLARQLIGVVNDYRRRNSPTMPSRVTVSDTISDLEHLGEEIKKRSFALWEQAKLDYPDE
jgi:hypothetical protein